jgi:hypothetical protein
LRGYRLPRSSRKLDVVIIAARYGKRSKSLKSGQAYLRRGLIWGDLVLIDRDELVGHLENNARVVTGKPGEIPGEFLVFNDVHLDKANGTQRIHVGELPAKGDDLGLPLF